MEMREKALDTMLWKTKSEKDLISQRYECMYMRYI